MRFFSIRELERLSGIKAHTIRIWESRYAAFSPLRTAANIRLYSIADLEHLLNLSLLNRRYRISKLMTAERSALEAECEALQDRDHKLDMAINSLLVYMYTEDIDQFDKLLDQCITQWGADKAFARILLPFLEKADILSYSSNGPDVHFVVTAIRRKIISRIEGLNSPPSRQEKVLLFLPQGEHYDIILLYMHYLLRRHGVHVFYLGTNISLDNLEKVAGDKRPSKLFSYITSRSFNEKAYVNAIKQHIPDAKMFIVHPFETLEKRTAVDNVIFYRLGEIGLVSS